MNELGERIRKLRKDRGMTLMDVAGDQLSKGMLSLIENGRAKPSMESLAFIAHQLGIDVHVLLEERSSREIKEFLAQIEERMSELDHIPYSETKKHMQATYSTLLPILQEKLPTTYEKGRLYEIGGRCLMNIGDESEAKQLIETAVQIYESLSLYNQALKAKSRFVNKELAKGNYTAGLKLLHELLEEHSEGPIVIDPVLQIELGYSEIVMLFGLGEYEEGKRGLERLLHFSKQNKVFYRMDDIYRLAAFNALMHSDIEVFKLYLTKSRQFAQFTDNNETYALSLFIEAHYHNERTEDYDLALALLEEACQLAKLEGEELGGYVYLEKGKAYWGKGMIDEAMDQFSLFHYPSDQNHPFDLAMLYTIDSYRALCLVEKGCFEEAMKHAEIAIQHASALPRTPYHDFIEETAERIKNQ
ncbi:helix-turn-helix domain-containing protein [Jeotgalibacillus sp. S-D1]|uniref:helix-turn-helix domain-containing protein n=1 Tax=Jeotgalibacillus sp. S-D1 TaxID=2552189 RepID=UPI001404CD2D|nr:helix-turn-helix transcriptional regulator [Jeotgalibacillus sp. S-D1]